MAAMASAFYVGTLGVQPEVVGEDGEETTGPEFLRERLRDWLAPADGPLPYELDPDAQPDATLTERFAEMNKERPLMAVEKVRFAEASGPFAERLRQTIAEQQERNP